MLLALLCFVIFLIILYLISVDREFDKIPGPPGIFLLHNSLDFLMEPVPLFYYIRMLCNKYKRIVRIKFGFKKIIILQNPDDIKILLNKVKYDKKGYLYDFIEPWLKDGLVTSYGSKWHQRRKLLTPAFHFNILAIYKSIIEDNCQTFYKKFKKEVGTPKTDLMFYITDFTVNAICETAMGIKLDKEEHNSGKRYKQGIKEICQYALYRAQRIWMYPNSIFKFTRLKLKQQNILRFMNSFRNQVIENRRNNNCYVDDHRGKDNCEVNLTGKQIMCMIDLLLQAERKGMIDTKGIGEEVDTFLFGGQETIAICLQFTMMLLANHQNTQEKVVNECNEIFGFSKRSTTMTDLTQMKYLECCIKESLRLYPPIPIITRSIQYKLQSDKYEIPVGTECIIPIFDLHRRSDQFVEPLEFRPERFLVEPTWNPYAYIPFSAGPRICIGLKFAMMELKLALSTVLRHYRLLAVTKPCDIVFVTNYVLQVKDPIYVRFEERK